MLDDLGICVQCGASGKVGAKCEYCGSTIMASHNFQDGSHSVIQSWSDFHLEGFSLLQRNVEGETDFPDYYVIKGERTGKHGLIDKYGTFVIPCIYKYVRAYLDYNICTIVTCEEQYGVLDFNGNTIIPLCGSSPLDIFVVQHGMIVGYNSVYDISGTLKINISSEDRIQLLSPNYATTFPIGKGIYDVNTGQQILSSEYKVDQRIDNDLYLVNRFTGNVTRYGVFKPITGEFLLPAEYLSIQEQCPGQFVARLQTVSDNATTEMTTMTLAIQNGNLHIDKEEHQRFQSGAGSGCMLIMLVLASIPLSIFFLL